MQKALAYIGIVLVLAFTLYIVKIGTEECRKDENSDKCAAFDFFMNT